MLPVNNFIHRCKYVTLCFLSTIPYTGVCDLMLPVNNSIHRCKYVTLCFTHTHTPDAAVLIDINVITIQRLKYAQSIHKDAVPTVQ
jgi:hypothetical protein